MPAHAVPAQKTVARPRQTRLRQVVQNARPPSSRRDTPQAGGIDMLDAADAVPQDRVLVIGGQNAELLCASLRRGCRSAIAVVGPAPLPEPADLVLAPRVATADQAAAIGAQARRAILAGARHGRLAIGLIGAGALALGRAAARRLRDYGFARARLRARAEGGILLLCDFDAPAPAVRRDGKA
ncbi:hypothetical protein KPL78_22370 [Roseomonas sp. HJA6]|uniref:Uncharacterized protein n=1 Tax=Roseomonas alba TaxID=2846776 RepID=A0ABS7AE87_9PROT|nr:hypothetical protein [Neoroseomonas alba]MBW6400621.1 hypothetical protein [Neoroseomonas alba]